MPGFMIGIDPNEAGVGAPSSPIYSYTWRLSTILGRSIPDSGTSPLIYVKDTTLPDYSFEQEEGPGSSSKYKYAKNIVWNDIKITIYSTLGLTQDLEDMKAKVWDPVQGLHAAGDYKFESAIEQYVSDDITISHTYYLNGSWIKALSHSNLTYASSDVHNVTVTLAYDWATTTFGSGDAGGSF